MANTYENARIHRQGAVLLITGLPAAGKTTLGSTLAHCIEISYQRQVTFLDGDEVRRILSSELGYSREHRQLNAVRHAYIAAEICRHGGMVVCALVAPYAADRAQMRMAVARHGAFIEIHLATPIEECERRDPKHLYARARAGELTHMTGIDDPYEAPLAPDIRFKGMETTANMIETVIDHLIKRGIVQKDRNR